MWCIVREMLSILWGGFKEAVSILAALMVVFGGIYAIVYGGIRLVAYLLDADPGLIFVIFWSITMLVCIIAAIVDLYRKARARCQ